MCLFCLSQSPVIEEVVNAYLNESKPETKTSKVRDFSEQWLHRNTVGRCQTTFILSFQSSLQLFNCTCSKMREIKSEK